MSEVHKTIIDLSQKILRNEEVTDEELREALQHIRRGRTAAQMAANSKADKRTQAAVTGDDLLNLFTGPKP